jgi:hypothetical protein
MRKRKKEPQVHRVYCTYFPDGRYYIGYSGKPQKQFEKYFGSSTFVKEYEGQLHKEVIKEYAAKSHAKMQEFLLQWKFRDDPLCLNDMLNIRLRASHLKEFTEVEDWCPSSPQQLQFCLESQQS